MTPQSSRSAKPVDDVESVKEALGRLWVKKGGEVAVGVNLLQALLDLGVGGEEEKDLPDSSRHDLGFSIQRQPVLPPARDPTELGHEGEELGEVVLLEEEQHGDLVPAREGRKLPSEFTEPAHWWTEGLSSTCSISLNLNCLPNTIYFFEIVVLLAHSCVFFFCLDTSYCKVGKW